MREGGFEPPQALSYHGLNVTRLTTPASPRKRIHNQRDLKFWLYLGGYTLLGQKII